MSNDKATLRAIVQRSLDAVIADLNRALRGEDVERLEATVQRLGRGGELPHWFAQLKADGALPNADGKTIGSVLEMLLVAILEVGILKNTGAVPLKLNPARGVDLPDLDLGVKSPSENFCTSEPFFSAYERLYGNDHDCVVLLTDYQISKKTSPLRLKIIKGKYMRGSEIADENLCAIARSHRDWLMAQGPNGEARAMRLFRFLAFVNQSDWQAKHLIRLITNLQKDSAFIDALLDGVQKDFHRQNKARLKIGRELIAEDELASLLRIRDISPRYIGVMDQIDNWVTETLKEAARSPSENERERLKTSPLDGKIGMSLALQWRYNFQRVFNGPATALPELGVPAEDLMTSPTDANEE